MAEGKVVVAGDIGLPREVDWGDVGRNQCA